MRAIGLLALSALGAGLLPAAGPVDFAQAALDAAYASRGLSGAAARVSFELSPVLPEDGFQIVGAVIRGGSARGLMYGLLEAADQIRAAGRLSPVKGEPVVALRSVRRVMTASDWERPRAMWDEVFTLLARARFNRLHLMLDEPLTHERIEALRTVSAAAQERAVDLAVGLVAPSVQDVIALLAACPAVRAVHVDPSSAGLISGPVREAGRYVVLESSEPVSPAVAVPLRVGAPAEKAIACEAPCSRYAVYPSEASPPASFAGIGGVEIQGVASEAWTHATYAVKKSAASAPSKRRAPARPAARKKR